MSKFVTSTEGKLNNARVAILSIVLFSVINIFAIAFANFYFLFSAYLPQIFISVAIVMGDQTILILMVVLSLVYILPYLLCWIFSKKHVGWMIGALVLFSIDSVFFLIDFLGFIAIGDYSFIIDLVFRVYALICLIMGVAFGLKQYKEKATQAASEIQSSEPLTANSLAVSAATRQITISRKKSFVGGAATLVVYENQKEIGRLKNGESKTFTVSANSFELGAAFTSGMAGTSLPISAGEEALHYETTIKTGFWANKILLTPVDKQN